MERIKELRVTLDAITKLVKDSLEPSREVSSAYTELQKSKMWFGKTLKDLKPTIEYTEDAASQEDLSLVDFPSPGFDQVQKIKHIRAVIEREVEVKVISFGKSYDAYLSQHGARYFGNAMDSAVMAAMWLGKELENRYVAPAPAGVVVFPATQETTTESTAETVTINTPEVETETVSIPAPDQTEEPADHKQAE